MLRSGAATEYSLLYPLLFTTIRYVCSNQEKTKVNAINGSRLRTYITIELNVIDSAPLVGALATAGCGPTPGWEGGGADPALTGAPHLPQNSLSADTDAPHRLHEGMSV